MVTEQACVEYRSDKGELLLRVNGNGKCYVSLANCTLEQLKDLRTACNIALDSGNPHPLNGL